jgi:hypothetical protein
MKQRRWVGPERWQWEARQIIVAVHGERAGQQALWTIFLTTSEWTTERGICDQPQVRTIFHCHNPHYMRKPHPRRARTKNGDTHIMHVHHCISHYRVIGDPPPGMSPISIHGRCIKLEHVSHYKTHLWCALRARVTNLIAGWGPYDTNTRCARGHASPITKKSETRFILARCWFNCRPGSLWH